MEILLYQIRNPGDPMLDQEELCFRRRLEPLNGLIPWRLRTVNLLDASPEEIASWVRSQAVFVGGSGSYGCVENRHPWFVPFCQALRGMVQSGHPMFCSCFGHQALAAALGGEVVTDRERAELGTHRITLTEAATRDPLWRHLPPTFLGQLGHNDRVSRMPEGAELLAYSQRCSVQAYRLRGLPIYATQFHPELDRAENRQRATIYLKVYDPKLAEPESLERLFVASPEAETLLPRFLEALATGELRAGAQHRMNGAGGGSKLSRRVGGDPVV